MSEAASLLSAYAAHLDQTMSTSKGNRVDFGDCGPLQSPKLHCRPPFLGARTSRPTPSLRAVVP